MQNKCASKGFITRKQPKQERWGKNTKSIDEWEEKSDSEVKGKKRRGIEEETDEEKRHLGATEGGNAKVRLVGIRSIGDSGRFEEKIQWQRR